MKVHKRKKYSRMHGRKMGTAGTGARKNKRKSGHRGGKGMSGTGKRADHKKTLITKIFGNNYFGKSGFTRGNNKQDKRKRINIGEIQEKYSPGEVDLSDYKILGTGEIKEKFVIKAKEASKSAMEKVQKAGGEIILPSKKRVPEEKVKKE
jgi:large subunit ribosomal protein L15